MTWRQAMSARVVSSLTAAPPTANGRAYEQKGDDNQYSDHFPGFLCGDGEGAQFASLALTALIWRASILGFETAQLWT
jgi:hypothetical protein